MTRRDNGPYAAEIEALSRAALTPWPPKGEGDRMSLIERRWTIRVCPECDQVYIHAQGCTYAGAFVGTRSREVEVVPLTDHRGAVEAIRTLLEHADPGTDDAYLVRASDVKRLRALLPLGGR